MNKSRLQELVLSLLEQGKEGEYWDFKQEWHEKIEDLLKDIICFTNNTQVQVKICKKYPDLFIFNTYADQRSRLAGEILLLFLQKVTEK